MSHCIPIAISRVPEEARHGISDIVCRANMYDAYSARALNPVARVPLLAAIFTFSVGRSIGDARAGHDYASVHSCFVTRGRAYFYLRVELSLRSASIRDAIFTGCVSRGRLLRFTNFYRVASYPSGGIIAGFSMLRDATLGAPA